MVQGNFDASLMQFLKLCSFSVYLMIVLLSVLSSLAVTYSELFWADQYIHQTHEAATMVGVDWVNFLNLHLQMFKKCTPWPCLLLDFAFSKLSELKRCRKQHRRNHMKQCKLFMPFNEWEQVHEEIKKRQHLHICIMNENTFAISSFALASFCLLVFLFCLHLSSKKFRNYYMHCEIIDCYSTYFC